jgi:Rod binding domain-containing protein
MDVTNMNTYLQTQYVNKMTQAAAEKTAGSLGGISANSSKEEITEAVKSFETYMMEQVLKEVKDTFVQTEDEDSSMSMYKDYFMDTAYTKVASQLVDEIGDTITEDFVEQIMRNYGITGTTNPVLDNNGLDADVVSDDIAKTNASTVTEVLA